MEKSFTFATGDGAHVRFEETLERDTIVLSITRDGAVSTARLTQRQVTDLRDILPGGYTSDALTCKSRRAAEGDDERPAEPTTNTGIKL